MYVKLTPVKLTEYRERKGMTRQALAASAGLSAPIIGKVEAGRYIPYDVELKRLADVLGVENPADLMKPLGD